MLGRTQPRRTGVRAALRDAREIYRQHSGAELNGGRQAARRLTRDRPDRTPAPGGEPAPAPSHRDDPDVTLDVSRLHVDEIDLNIDELKARVALEAHVLDLLRLDVGVDAALRGVGLQIKGVDAQALLKVRLENLTVIVDRVMSTIDRNPQILERLTERLGATLDEVAAAAAEAVGDIGAGAGSAIQDVGGIARAVPSRHTTPSEQRAE